MRLPALFVVLLVCAAGCGGGNARTDADRQIAAIGRSEDAVLAQVRAGRPRRVARCTPELLRSGFRIAAIPLETTRLGSSTSLAPAGDDPPFFLVVSPPGGESFAYSADTGRRWAWGEVRHVRFGADVAAVHVVNRLISASCPAG